MTDTTVNPKALQLMERGIKALQKKNYKQAATAFSSVLEKYPGERVLRDRALGFIKTCERLTAAKPDAPIDGEQILHLATYHLNRREFEEARALLDKAKRKASIKAETAYAFAVLHALEGNHEEALTALADAIALDDTCRFSARTESDFVELNELEQFKELVN